jgi:hypothetical protein
MFHRDFDNENQFKAGATCDEASHPSPHFRPVAGAGKSVRRTWRLQWLLVHVLADRQQLPQTAV